MAGINAEGQVLVTQGNAGPIVAELATAISDQALLLAIERAAPVLIDFIEGNAEHPVILGLLRDRLDIHSSVACEVREPRIELTASESLELRCGASAIELQRDGRVVIRGVEVRSVATAGNLIQGAHVDIN